MERPRRTRLAAAAGALPLAAAALWVVLGGPGTRPPEGTPPAAGFIAQASASSFGGRPVWGPVGILEDELPLLELRKKVEELQRNPGGPHDADVRGLALGELSLLYAWRVACTSPEMPSESSSAPPGGDANGRAARTRWRLAVGRFLATHPSSRAHVAQAERGYRRAIAHMQDKRGQAMARRGLAEVLCMKGRLADALRAAEQAEAVLGGDERTRRVRFRSLVGLGRLDDAQRLFPGRPHSGGSGGAPAWRGAPPSGGRP